MNKTVEEDDDVYSPLYWIHLRNGLEKLLTSPAFTEVLVPQNDDKRMLSVPSILVVATS